MKGPLCAWPIIAAFIALSTAVASPQEQAAPKSAAQPEDLLAKALNLLPSKQWLEIKTILVEGIKGMPENWSPIEVQAGATPEEERVLFNAWDSREVIAFLTEHASQRPAAAPGPSYSKAYWLLGAADLEIGSVKDAEDALDRGLKLEPDQPTLLCEKAFCYQKEKRYQEALDLYKRAAAARTWASRSEMGRAWRGQGNCLTDLGQLDAAESALRTALQFSPGHLAAVNSLGFVRRQRQTSSRR